MDFLPPELLTMILQPELLTTTLQMEPCILPLNGVLGRRCVTNTSFYLSLRLVCKAFNAIITPQAFRRLLIHSNEASLSRLNSVASSSDLASLVREYGFTIMRPHFVHSMARDYLWVASQPEDVRVKVLAEGIPRGIRIDQFAKQLEFASTSALYDEHVEAIKKLPNLKELRLLAPFGDLCFRYHRVSQTASAGVTVFRAMLAGMAARDPTNPVTSFVMGPISDECLILEPSFIPTAMAGFRRIQSLTLVLTCLDEGSELLLCRLVQSVPQLHALSLTALSPSESGSLAPFLLRPALRVDAYASEREVHRFTRLHSLRLKRFGINSRTLLRFLQAHSSGLTNLTIDECTIRYECSTCAFHKQQLSAEHVDEDEEEVNSWAYVFRSLRPRLSALKSLSLRHLSQGKSAHDHLSDEEAGDWRDYLLGKASREPVGLYPLKSARVPWCRSCIDQYSGDGYYADGISTAGWWIDESSSEADSWDYGPGNEDEHEILWGPTAVMDVDFGSLGDSEDDYSDDSKGDSTLSSESEFGGSGGESYLSDGSDLSGSEF